VGVEQVPWNLSFEYRVDFLLAAGRRSDHTLMTRAAKTVSELVADICVTDADNDLLFAADGTQYIDVFSGGGTVFLGNKNRVIVGDLIKQLRNVWITGTLPTPARRRAAALVEGFFGDEYRLACFYSTGMEAAEFALRFSRVTTRRREFVGFQGCMHGKSMATAYLGWPNEFVSLPDFHRLPYLRHCSEQEILQNLGKHLAAETVAAVFLEPLAGSSGGHVVTPGFCAEVTRLCAKSGTLLICDEIFTGFHRTGPAFLHQELGMQPDIVLMGKAMGNGFPVSAVVVRKKYSIEPEMLPGSTYSNNPLGACAAAATIGRMREMDLPRAVSNIEQTITASLTSLGNIGVTLRGKGALWVLELPPNLNPVNVGARLLEHRVLPSMTGPFIRVLPAATISTKNLADACEGIRRACSEEHSHQAGCA
jgi:acetylornithine/succinyldiaminopimelate/putrescine aminotransferase